jgi:hypothetical protein
MYGSKLSQKIFLCPRLDEVNIDKYKLTVDRS